MRRLVVSLGGLFVLSTSSCAALFLFATPPEATLSQSLSCPPGTKGAKDVQVHAVRPWSHGIVVLYSGHCLSQKGEKPAQEVFGYKVLQRSGISWQPSSSDSYMSTAQPRSQQLLEYSVGKSTAQQDNYAVLYGQVLVPEVKAVEATFDNGETVRTNRIDGAFALISPGARGVCEIRAMGADNQVLRRDDLATLYQFVSSPNKETPECLPVTRQL